MISLHFLAGWQTDPIFPHVCHFMRSPCGRFDLAIDPAADDLLTLYDDADALMASDSLSDVLDYIARH